MISDHQALGCQQDDPDTQKAETCMKSDVSALISYPKNSQALLFLC